MNAPQSPIQAALAAEREQWTGPGAQHTPGPEVFEPDSESAHEALPDRLLGRGDWLSSRGRFKDMQLMYAAACKIRELRRALKSSIAKAEGSAS